MALNSGALPADERCMPETAKMKARRRSEGVKLAIVSGVFVLGGIALGGAIPWYVTAFFGVGVVVGVLMSLGILKAERAPLDLLAIDDAGITRTAPGLREHVAWGDIVRVRIMTTDQGPQLEDVFFVLEGRSGDGCVVPHDLAQRGDLLHALQSRLEGVNNAAVIEAMLSSENRVLTIWEAKDPVVVRPSI